MDDLARKRRPAGLEIVVRGDENAALAAVRSVTGIAKASTQAAAVHPLGVHEIRCTWGKKLDDVAMNRAAEEVVAALVQAGCFVREARMVRSSLEEVFAELTRGAPAEGDATAEAAS
jgi:hypothetical protein